MADDLVMTFTFKPGTLTLEKSLKIQKTALALMNAVANDVQPGVGEFWKPEHLHWINDGKDEMTIRFSAATRSRGAGTVSGEGEQ